MKKWETALLIAFFMVFAIPIFAVGDFQLCPYGCYVEPTPERQEYIAIAYRLPLNAVPENTIMRLAIPSGIMGRRY